MPSKPVQTTPKRAIRRVRGRNANMASPLTRLQMEPLEARTLPDGQPLALPALGAGLGQAPQVRVLNPETGATVAEYQAYETGFTGGVHVATADINQDGVADLIVGPGAGGGPRVRVLDGSTGDPLAGPWGNFWAFEPSFAGGVEVAAADVDGDGTSDVILGAGTGGGPRVRVLSGKDGAALADFFAFSPQFTGGVSVAAADLNGDGKAEVIIGSGPGGGPLVKTFDLASGRPELAAGPFGSFFAFESEFTGGVNVAASDVNGDDTPDLILGAGTGGGPRVRILSGRDGTVLADFFAFDQTYTGGVRVTGGDVDGDGRAEVVVTAGRGLDGQVRVFDGTSGKQRATLRPFAAGGPFLDQPWSPANPPLLGDTTFDISGFKVTLPDTLDPSMTRDMNGLRFYGGQAFAQSQSTVTFGSSTAPTYVLIGLVGPTFTPMLMAYGTVTLNTNNGGIDFFNSVSWTQGLYTVGNQLAIGETPAQVSGGMTIQPLDGGFYTDSLLNAGTDFTIQSFANGTITTSAPNSFTPGQNLQFADLSNPTGGVTNGTGYYVDTVISLTQFTIKAIDGHDVSKAAAGGGTVTTIPSPSDSENWGALIPNGQQMQLTTTDQRTTHTVYAGFTPNRILLTKTTDAVPEPVLQFSGVQTIEYKGGNITAGMGFQSANDAQYLQINYLGYYAFVNAGNGGDNEAVVTVSVGSTPLTDRVTSNGIVDGVVQVISEPQNFPVEDDDWIHFTNLTLPTPEDGSPLPLTVGTSYQVTNVTTSGFELIDPETGEAGFAAVNASAATAVLELDIAEISQQNVTVNGASVERTIVETRTKHNFAPGDAITFKDLQLDSGALGEGTYYVTEIFGDDEFAFAEERGKVFNPLAPVTSGQAGRVTYPLGKMFGLDVGGNGTLTFSFDGGYQSGDWVKPTDFKIGFSGEVSASYLPESGTALAGTISAKGDSETSEGLVLEWAGDHVSVAAGAVNITGSLAMFNSTTKQQKLGVTLSGISVSEISADGIDTYSLNGSIGVAFPGLGWSGTANFGHGETNGLTLTVDSKGNRTVQEFAISAVIDRTKPPAADAGTLAGRFNFMGGSISIDYNRGTGTNSDDWSLLVGGSATIAVGDSTPDANGNWRGDVDAVTVNLSPGALKLSEHGVTFLPGRYEFDLNGPFNVAGLLKVTTKSLKFVYQSADPATNTDEQYRISGGASLPDLRNASIQLGNDGASGGLVIDRTTKKWQIEGIRITIPSFPIGTLFDVSNFVIGFSKTTDANGNDDYDIEAGGQVKLLSGKLGGTSVGLHVKFDVDNGKLKVADIGVALRGMNPGIPIEPVDGFLTDIAFEVDGIPGAVSADILFGAVFGGKVTVGAKEYAMVQAIVNGEYKYKDISLTGRVLIGGGLLGEVDGALDFNWGTGTYTVSLSGKFFYDIAEGDIDLYFSDQIDYGLFGVKLLVPSNIPIIGGTVVLGADAMYFVDHGADGKKFFAAWYEFLGRWRYGVEKDFVKDKISLIGTSTIDGFSKDLPGGTGNKPHQYNIAYSPTLPTMELKAIRGLEDDESSDSYGLINVTWGNPNASDDTIFIASGDTAAVQVYGPGTAYNSNGWVDDPNGGVSYMVLPDQSSPGNVFVHVAPTASFTAPGASYDNPDLYVPLPNAALNVVLTSENPQDDNVTATWEGSFAAAAPELQNVTVTQPRTASALGNDASNESDPDPVTADNATISFQWRGLDPDSTDVSLYYDYNGTGYNGTHLTTVNGSDLTVSDPDGDGWRTVTVPWDIGDLDPARPLYIYAVIKDNGHAPFESDYAGQVQTVPAAQIQVSYTGGTSVSSTELADLLLQVTPVKEVDVQSISDGVVTVSDTTGISVGDQFLFSGLYSPVGVSDTMPYYVLSVTATTFTFSNVAAGAPITEASSGPGDAYVDQDVPTVYGTNTSGLVWPHVDVNQTYRFSMSPPRNVFAAALAGDQEASNVGELVQYNTFVGNNQLLRMSFQFKVEAAIAGTVSRDLSDNGQLDSMDPGLAGATVYLDDNNNNVLDPGEEFVVTGPDGNYLFVHQWADTDTPTTMYTTFVKVIPPAGWKVTSTPTLPSGGITFTNDGNEPAALNYYNFMIASPITIGGIVYDDANQNGVRDPGEKGLPGVTVTVTPSSGSPINVTTDVTGVWTASSYARGTYNVSVTLPSGGTFTTATSTSFTTSTPSTVRLNSNGQGSYGGYSQNGVGSIWNPLTNQYDVWMAAVAVQTVDDTPRIDFVNLQSRNTDGSSNIVATSLTDDVASPLEVLMGKWGNDNNTSPTVAYSILGDGGGRGTELSVTASGGYPFLMFPGNGAGPDAKFALSYDPTTPQWSTIASINSSRQVVLWKFNGNYVGNFGDNKPFSGSTNLFTLPSGTPVKMTGFNSGGSNHLQSRDLAVAYVTDNGVIELAVWNAANNSLRTFAIGGRVFVDMIAGDFDANGREDVAVITADTNSQKFYLNVLLTQDDGSVDLIPHVGTDLAIGTDGSVRTNLAAIRVKGAEQALLWLSSSADGTQTSINSATVTGGQLRTASAPVGMAGRIVALTAGDVGTPAQFAIYAGQQSGNFTYAVQNGSVRANADGMLAVSGDLTKYGGTYSGFDVGITGIAVPNNYVTSRPFRDDASSGVNSSTTYTHALSFNGEANVTVNGVAFTAAGYGSTTGAFQIDAFDPTTNTAGVMGGFQGLESQSGLTGGFNEITGSALYTYSGANGVQRVVLRGLTPGQTYTTTFYYVGRGNPGERLITLSDSLGGSYLFDANAVGDKQGGMVSRTFIATGPTITYYFTPHDTNDVYVNYALTNSIAVSTTSGIVYNDANSNGIQDPGETSLPGMTVRLVETNNVTQTTVTSDGSDGQAVGSYSFDNVHAGAYLQVTLPPGTWTAENPPPGVSTNANGSHGLVVGVTFTEGQSIQAIDFTDGNDNEYSTAIKAGDLQASGRENLIVRTSSALFVQRFQSDGTFVFDRYDVSSPAAYFRPELYVEDVNGDSRPDIITSGQSGVDVFVNTGLGVFRPITGLLADTLNNTPNGSYSARGFTDDASSGISTGKTYTHALNFGGSDMTVNGVTLAGAPETGTNYALAAVDPRTGQTSVLTLSYDFAVLLDGNFDTIAERSYQSVTGANGALQFRLSGLMAGLTYTTTFYTVGNNVSSTRIQTVVDSVGGTLTFDANGGENLNGYMVTRTFTATSDSVVFTFFAQDPNTEFNFNLIAATNELVPAGHYTTSALTGDADSGLAATKTYTHLLDFEATQAVTVNGKTFTGAAREGANFSVVAYDPISGQESEIEYFLNDTNNVSGQLNSAISNGYVSQTGVTKLVLTGLTPGATYTTTFFTAGNGTGVRIQGVTDSEGGSYQFDENAYGNGNGAKVTSTYTATAHSITFIIRAADPNSPFMLSALANEIVTGAGYTTPVAFGGDGDSGIDAAQHYTHALDFAATSAVTVNGLSFAPAGQSGPNWSLTGYDPNTGQTSAMATQSNFGNALTGGMETLASNFYSTGVGGEQLTLTGLAIGATYTTTWYSVGYQSGVARVTSITDSEGGFTTIDQNQFGSGNGITFSRTFTASHNSITFTFVAANPSYGFHQFALTNRLVTSGNYTQSSLTGDADSGISTAKIYTHAIDFAGNSTVTVNGVSFLRATESGSNFTLQAVDAGSGDPSGDDEVETYVGLSNNVTGGLNAAMSNFYYSGTGAETLTLSGLVPGTTYTTTFYGVGFGGTGRVQTVSDSEGGVFYFDENAYGDGNGIRVTRTFTASSDSITYTFVGDNLGNSFHHYAMTNEVVTPPHRSPPIYGTELAVVPASGRTPAKIYAAQQNSQTVYELAWDNGTGTLVPTGRFFPLDRLVTRLEAGSIATEGALDFVVYENSNNGPAAPVGQPDAASYQKLWLYTADNGYAKGQLIDDLGFGTYEPQVDMLLAPLFTGVQTVVFLGFRSSESPTTTDVVTYRTGSGVHVTPLTGVGGYSLGVGSFIPGDATPNIVVAGGNTITILQPGVNPDNASDPTGPDPGVPLVVMGTSYTPYSINTAAVGASVTSHSDDLMGVRYDEATGFTVVPFFNITGGYAITGNAGGSLYDFPVVIPGSNGGTINGRVYYDANGNGQWDPTDYGVSDDVTVYLDLNNNGVLDSTEPRAFPNRDGDYQFAQRLPQAYTVGLQMGTGYTLTTPASLDATIPSVPGAQVNGIDFGLKAKDFGADLNNDHQPDLLLSDPQDRSVYVQLRNGRDRLGTEKIGTLPSADWSVVGIYDLTGNGTADVLIHDLKTGELRMWDFFPGRGSPAVARTYELNYVVPAGYTLLGVADLDRDGKPELIIGRESADDYRAVELEGLNAIGSRALTIPHGMSLVSAADIDQDGDADLLLRDRTTGHLLLNLYERGESERVIDLGKPNADWSVAGIQDVIPGDKREILFQEKSTGKGFAWQLSEDLSVESTIDLDIGTHKGLRLHLSESFPDSPSAAGRIVAVSGGADGSATLYGPDTDGHYGTPTATLVPFPGFGGEVRSAMADVNGDGVPDTIFVTGPGGPTRFTAISGTDNATVLIPPTAPFAGSETFSGGGFVAAGDFDGDGRAEIVVSPDAGGGPRVSVFSLRPTGLTTRADFFGIDDPSFRGGARTAVGDVNGDGMSDLIVTAGAGGGPRVAIWDGESLLSGSQTRLVNDFFAFPGEDAAQLRDGVYIAAGDVDGDGYADLVFGAGLGGGPRVFVLSGALVSGDDIGGAQEAPVANFFGGNPEGRGGIRVAVKNLDGDGKADVVTGDGPGAGTRVTGYAGASLAPGGVPSALFDLDADFEFLSGVYVG